MSGSYLNLSYHFSLMKKNYVEEDISLKNIDAPYKYEKMVFIADVDLSDDGRNYR